MRGCGIVTDASRPPTRQARRYGPTALPWLWYLVRDLGPWLDGVALALPPMVGLAVVVSLLMALLVRSLPAAATVASWSVFALVAIVLPWAPKAGPDPVPGVRIAAVNVKGSSAPEGILASLGRAHPDIVVVSETSEAVEHGLAREYAWHVAAPEPGDDVVVFSDVPLRPLSMPEPLRGQRGVRVQVDGPGGAFVLYAMHLVKPGASPEGNYQVTLTVQRQVTRALAQAVAGETLPVVVAGDLNLSDRTWGYRHLTGPLDDGARSRWTGPTSTKPSNKPLLLRIDHILIPPPWCAARSGRLPLPGSDHRGVVSTIGPCPAR